MGVFKRKNKYWIDYYDSQKNRIQESSHSSSKRDAEDLLSIRKSEILRGTFKRPVKITFKELGTKYMEYAKVNKRSWLRDQQMLESLTKFLGSERQVKEIYPADIEGFKLHRRKEVSGSTGDLNGSTQHFLEVYSQESENLESLAGVDLSAALLCPVPTG